METILEKIIAAKRQEVIRAKVEKPFACVLREAEAMAGTAPRRSLKAALRQSSTGVIAEFKRKSPSKGFIHAGAKVEEIIPGYVQAGATALSILTDENFFGGSLNDLAEARRLADIPVLRKDFIVDIYQICEAKLYGADAILLIASALSLEQTFELADSAHHIGLEVLLEIHHHGELDYCHAPADIIGVNNRNLNNFVTGVQVSFEIASKIPPQKLKISESGISSPETVKALRKAGYLGFLMGENFMKQPAPALALQQFIRAL
ncbi:MAG: indole-3-glycerol phosphate synthase TrpC [Bacteroidales bacterium]|jgi:indole-3-glycerol phosphate synthase|nr:indole-3-glycerol phosphate synthase TrpC [Bacteroidales bacterium]